jgi:hypothetical protein
MDKTEVPEGKPIPVQFCVLKMARVLLMYYKFNPIIKFNLNRVLMLGDSERATVGSNSTSIKNVLLPEF